MGVVYGGTHIAMDRQVAIKVLPETSANRIARFQREARSMSKLSHQNVVQVYDFGSMKNRDLFLVMEFLEGVPLSNFNRQVMDAHRLLHIIIQVCRALEVAHDKSIVHRDLKPDNIFLVTDVEGRDQVKVLDFGIAKVLTDSGKPDDLTLTHAGRVCGTPHFMAPEQITLGTVDGRVDLYAIGVSLFQLLTGRRLFPAGSKEHILSKHLYEVPMGIREAAPDAGYSKRLETVIAKCLSKEANMRYQSARSLRKELELFLNGNLPIFDSTTAYDDDETIDRLLPKPDATGAGDLASNSSGSGSEMMIVPPTSSDHTWQKGKVLLVDDSLYLSSQLSELLHERGFEVLLARNGEEGLEQLALHPDVVMCVTDINMPKMDGIQLLQAIRTTPAIAELQVMVMSAANDKSLFRRAQELGVFAWVVKPAHPESIVEAIEQTVDKS